LRLPSLTDRYIKRNEFVVYKRNEVRKIDEDESGEFIGIIYIMALIQLELGVVDQPDSSKSLTTLYDTKILTWELMGFKV
jgi:hypothetical protein